MKQLGRFLCGFLSVCLVVYCGCQQDKFSKVIETPDDFIAEVLYQVNAHNKMTAKVVEKSPGSYVTLKIKSEFKYFDGLPFQSKKGTKFVLTAEADKPNIYYAKSRGGIEGVKKGATLRAAIHSIHVRAWKSLSTGMGMPSLPPKYQKIKDKLEAQLKKEGYTIVNAMSSPDIILDISYTEYLSGLRVDKTKYPQLNISVTGGNSESRKGIFWIRLEPIPASWQNQTISFEPKGKVEPATEMSDVKTTVRNNAQETVTSTLVTPFWPSGRPSKTLKRQYAEIASTF